MVSSPPLLTAIKLTVKLTIMIQEFIITVLVIYGVHGSTRPDMILAPIRSWLSSLLYHKSNDCNHVHSFRNEAAYKTIKVLFDCTPCMASLYGTISYFIVVFPHTGFIFLPVWVFSLSGFNYILNKILNR